MWSAIPRPRHIILFGINSTAGEGSRVRVETRNTIRVRPVSEYRL